jgi:FtsH-binding integral membrane protein
MRQGNPEETMPDLAKGGGLRTIFSVFLGLMLTAFVGVGVYTFHPPPAQHEREIRELSRSERAIRDSRPPGELTEAERAEVLELVARRDALSDAGEAARRPWGRTTSIILIVFATLTMGISLLRADQLPVISNGLLLGGVFIMLYGVGWIIATDESVARFLIMTGSLSITLALGYARFGRRAAPAGPSPGHAAERAGIAEIELRVRELELRLSDAASALAASREHSRSG